jgi:hypothetical protein
MGSFPGQRRQETVQHLSLSSALGDVIARRRNLCHQLMGISSVSQGNVLLDYMFA